jgi:hypothetical protein
MYMMKRDIRRFLWAIMVIAAMSFAGAAAAADLTQPVIDREASEEALLRAYVYFLQNRLWNSLDELAESLKQNVYFVDAYYMRGLVFRRLGRYTDAIDAMSQYLEVRREDHRARIILDTMKSEWEKIISSIVPEKASGVSFASHTINSFLRLPVYSRLSLKGLSGLGKIAATEENIVACDTLGDKIWIFDRKGRHGIKNVAIERPAAVTPLTPSEMLLFKESGEVCRVLLDASNNAILSSEGELGVGVVDASLIDSTLCAVADRKGGAVRFFEIPEMRQTVSWKPSDSGGSDRLFEPVAVASLGSLLAVADRGNGRIFVLDSYTLAILDNFDLEKPRDVDWGGEGELYILDEKGVLYSRYPVGFASPDLKIAAEGMRDAWSLSWADDGLIAANVSGRVWWDGQSKPGRSQAFGAVTLHDPWIVTLDKTETLMLRGAASSTFHDFMQDKTPMTQVVWRGEARPSRVVSIGAGHEGEARFYSSAAGEARGNEKIAEAISIADVMSDIAGLSRQGERIPRVIVLDSRISAPDAQLKLFLAFLLRQGIRLDLWSLGKPASPMLCRISRITLGRTYYTKDADVSASNDSVEWVLSVPMPPDAATFGYPSDTTLSLFSDIDVIRFTDWIPIWPSLIYQNASD